MVDVSVSVVNVETGEIKFFDLPFTKLDLIKAFSDELIEHHMLIRLYSPIKVSNRLTLEDCHKLYEKLSVLSEDVLSVFDKIVELMGIEWFIEHFNMSNCEVYPGNHDDDLGEFLWLKVCPETPEKLYNYIDFELFAYDFLYGKRCVCGDGVYVVF